jgi:hypothetical protein
MQVIIGTVIDGKIVAEDLALPEGTIVTIISQNLEPAIQLPSHLEAELLDALDEANHTEGISGTELFDSLRTYG